MDVTATKGLVTVPIETELNNNPDLNADKNTEDLFNAELTAENSNSDPNEMDDAAVEELVAQYYWQTASSIFNTEGPEKLGTDSNQIIDPDQQEEDAAKA